MHRRILCTIALAALVTAAGAGCSDDKSSSAGTSSAPGTSSVAAAGSAGDYCHAVVELSRSTRDLALKPDISPAEYGKAADEFDKVKAIAPAQAAADLDTIGSGYRAISKGQATIQSIGPDIAKASLHLSEVNRTECIPGAPK
ncbi:hypothetical protein [Nocardia sp. NPDC049149]|uniref:hypothetical protein n=1 Tax=Nocardia sp. NPDC049149 TaxID=3364315 RepID=UPI0037236FF4